MAGPNAIALTPETYGRFDRVASRVGLIEAANGPGVPVDGGLRHLLRVASSTIGTYGYPCKIQEFDPSDGTWADSESSPDTVYLADPTGAVLSSGEYYESRFVGYRGAASEAVYVAVRKVGNRVRMTRLVSPIESHPTMSNVVKAWVQRWNTTDKDFEDDFEVWLVLK